MEMQLVMNTILLSDPAAVHGAESDKPERI